MLTMYMRVNENIRKRKYSIDDFGLFNGPLSKRPKLDIVTALCVNLTHDDDFVTSVRDNAQNLPLITSDSSFEDM